MCGSTLSNPLDFFEFAFFTMLIISSEYVGVQKKLDTFFFINCVGSLPVCVKFTLRRCKIIIEMVHYFPFVCTVGTI